MKRVLFLLLLASSPCLAQDSGAVHWMSFPEAVARSQKNPQKIFIDVYTHWCGWCKRMDATTFRDSAVAAYMNAHFYAVKLDAETRDSIPFRDHVFRYDSAHKANNLAVSLLGGNMGYPSFVFLDESFNLITHISGYQTPEQMSPALRYFSEDRFKTQSFEEYQKGTGAK